jgi:hypothetical protein
MRLGNALAILVASILLTTGGAFAGAAKSSSGKADHPAAKSPPAAVLHVKPQAPIVMGRSISVHRKSKMHHVKVKPSESGGLHEDSQL